MNVICTKQKDDEEAKPIKLDFETVLLDIFDEEHNELETLVKIKHSAQSPAIGNQLANEIIEHIEAQPLPRHYDEWDDPTYEERQLLLAVVGFTGRMDRYRCWDEVVGTR